MMLSPAGGLIYHIRAAIYGKKKWMPFREAVNQWLSIWNPPEKNIIIVGASGGYMLNHDFIDRFDHVLVIDPDPISELIFRKRFSSLKTSIKWDRNDYFTVSGDMQKKMEDLLVRNNDVAILFSNFLGQIPFLIDDEEKRGNLISYWQKNLVPLLQGRSWSSFHDRYSCRITPPCRQHFHSDLQITENELISRFYGENARGEWTDHHTEGYFPDQRRYDYFLWQITPRYFHIIEGVFSTR